MSNVKDGGPAFPLPVAISPQGNEHIAYPGVTVRDYFAGKCVAAMVNTIRSDADYQRYRDLAAEFGLDSVSEWFARESYKQADAMLKARKVQP